MTQTSRKTRNHDEIRRWVEDRGGRPATVRGTAPRGEVAGVLRIEFPGRGKSGEKLVPLDWSHFFEKFDEDGLEFVYEEETEDGTVSLFHKLEPR